LLDVAEHAGDATPYGLQHLLSRAKWDADAVRDDLRSFAIEQLHDRDAVSARPRSGEALKAA
jgi:hypothetical protein